MTSGSASSSTAANAELVLEIEIVEDDSTLVRLLTVLRRRACVIRQVHYEAGDRHSPGRVLVAVSAPAGRAHCVVEWLRNVVVVTGVTTKMPRTPAGAPTARGTVPDRPNEPRRSGAIVEKM